MSNSSTTALGLLLGTAIGAAAGILFAPDKGSNTRKKLTDEASHVKDRVSTGAIDLKEQVVNSMASSKVSLESQLESLASNASYKAEDVITTLEKKLSDLKAKNKKLQKTS